MEILDGQVAKPSTSPSFAISIVNRGELNASRIATGEGRVELPVLCGMRMFPKARHRPAARVAPVVAHGPKKRGKSASGGEFGASLVTAQAPWYKGPSWYTRRMACEEK